MDMMRSLDANSEHRSKNIWSSNIYVMRGFFLRTAVLLIICSLLRVFTELILPLHGGWRMDYLSHIRASDLPSEVRSYATIRGSSVSQQELPTLSIPSSSQPDPTATLPRSSVNDRRNPADSSIDTTSSSSLADDAVQEFPQPENTEQSDPETLPVEGSLIAPSLLEQAIDAYKSKVILTNAKAQKCVAHRRDALPASMESVNVTYALECLRLTTPDLNLEYPVDAEEHFNEIRLHMAQWAQHEQHKIHKFSGFEGPWIENQFISRFEPLFDQESDNHSCLPDFFGPFIPLFIPWVDHWVNANFDYPSGFAEAVRSVLRPNVPYLAVSQNAQGISIHADSLLAMKYIPNVLVLSSGGYGHVPIPLLKQEEAPNNAIDVHDRAIDVAYVGSLQNAPRDARKILHEALLSQQNDTSISYKYHYGEDWRKVMSNSRYNLAPRGFGRTSYHVMETLQMGLVPIHIYLDDDQPWIPYETLFNEIGYVTTFSKAADLLRSIQNTTDAELRQREDRILALRNSHFSFHGLLNQIGSFMNGTHSDLKCQALPSTVTGE